MIVIIVYVLKLFSLRFINQLIEEMRLILGKTEKELGKMFSMAEDAMEKLKSIIPEEKIKRQVRTFI